MNFNNEWITEFVRINGRAPKILHMGNIANNAYNNAKMLNKAGCDCDVLCNDYYHVMACPEWEDSGFVGKITNDYYPNWKKVDLKGFNRPRWFAQGPRKNCLNYLVAKNIKDEKAAQKAWKSMERWRCLLSIVNTSKFLSRTKPIQKLAIKICASLRQVILYIAVGTKSIFTHPLQTLKKIVNRPHHKDGELPNQLMLQKLTQEYNALFPDRPGTIGEEINSFIDASANYAELFSYYDIIIGYALECVYPFLCGVENYIAYEHGTIRQNEWFYQDTQISRLWQLSYANAKVIYVTNLDNVESARYLSKNSNAKIVYGLHGIDIDNISVPNQRKDEFDCNDGAKLFFCPSRHDYVIYQNKLQWLKGEDLIIPAIKKMKKLYPGQFKVAFLNWGGSVQLFKDYLRENEVADCVVWTAPMNKPKFLKTMKAADLILDQFLLKAFGGITIEALCIGSAPLCMPYINEDVAHLFFSESIPAFCCKDSEDIFDAMELTILNTEKCKDIAEAGAKWIKRNHGKDAIVEKMLCAFSFCITFAS